MPLQNSFYKKESLDKWFKAFLKPAWKKDCIIYTGFQQLKAEGFSVDAVAPQAAIYLTIQADLTGKKQQRENCWKRRQMLPPIFKWSKDCSGAVLCIGADKTAPGTRLSVGTCKTEEIDEMLQQLRTSLTGLAANWSVFLQFRKTKSLRVLLPENGFERFCFSNDSVPVNVNLHVQQ